MVHRIFHPIGQGAFYSERHSGFNMVFDCGTKWNKTYSRPVVKNSFNKRSVIDILFISHFDDDHVNRIEILMKYFKIKKVVLPVLHDNEPILLTQIFNILGMSNISDMIDSPEKYFGEDTNIIRVSQYREDQNYYDEEPINIDDLASCEISSGRKLKRDNWIFVPYNLECGKRRQKLESLFLKFKINMDEFCNNPKYAIKHRRKIKMIYSKLHGDINRNSMMLYSGPLNNIYYKICFWGGSALGMSFPILRYNAGCLFTGDSNLNDRDLKLIFNRYWSEIGTIQVPHHGSLSSFDKNILNDMFYSCPISVGNNAYGHPSNQVISDILSHHCHPIIVSELPNSFYIENIIPL